MMVASRVFGSSTLAVTFFLTHIASGQSFSYPDFSTKCSVKKKCLQEISIDLDADHVPEIVRIYVAEVDHDKDKTNSLRNDRTFVVFVRYGDGSQATPLVGNFDATDEVHIQSREGNYAADCSDWSIGKGCGFTMEHVGKSFAFIHKRLGVFVFTGPSAYRRVVKGAKGGLSVRQFFLADHSAGR